MVSFMGWLFRGICWADEWIMKLQEKSKGLGGMVCFDAGHCGLGPIQ